MDHITEMLPIIYTPTVGEACQRFGHVFRRPRGLYVSAADRGRIGRVLANWPERDVAVIVVTDGQRILGLGDLGAYGMGIPIGKVALYTACAGIHPWRCLPVMLDVGTDTESLLRDELYTGLRSPRLRGAAYLALLDEFVSAVSEQFPTALLQFEDFAAENAVGLLARYRDHICTFNDDIQGTAAVALAAMLAAGRVAGRRLEEERVLFVGAGSAATGIAGLLADALRARGVREPEVRDRIWMYDARGLLTDVRSDLPPYARPYARGGLGPVRGIEEAVALIRPTVLVGATGQAGLFGEPVLRALAESALRPLVLALSNPTSRAECTAEQAYRWTSGSVQFASGSPFAAVELDGRRLEPSQANNAYVFPGVGLGVTATGASRVTDRMFLAAADALAAMATPSLPAGALFPPLQEIRRVSVAVGAAVVRVAMEDGLARRAPPADLEAYLDGIMYEPRYPSYLAEEDSVNGGR
jgi:malate dehydrogenase (oxaloacetate-decarboxylating)(NADP+)